MSPLRLAIDPSADMPHRQLTNLEMSSIAPLSSITTPENSSCGMMSIGAMAMARSGLLNADDTNSRIATPTTEVDVVGLLRMTIGALHIATPSLLRSARCLTMRFVACGRYDTVTITIRLNRFVLLRNLCVTNVIVKSNGALSSLLQRLHGCLTLRRSLRVPYPHHRHHRVRLERARHDSFG